MVSEQSAVAVQRMARTFLLGVILALSSPPAHAAPQPPTDLRVENLVNPLGIGDLTPQFSWLPQGDVQTAYQILVASSVKNLKEGKADKWDSGRVRSDRVAFVVYEGKPLRSREICYWKVRTWNGNGEASGWSKVARFEMGLLSNDDWNVAWIWREKKDEAEDYVYFRRSFALEDKRIARARAYVTAAHRHEFYLNGKLVGKGPNFAYPEYQYYQTFDIAPFLKRGRENVFGLLCHWYGAGQGRPYSRWGMLFKAMIDFDDGSSVVIGSDRTWKVRRGEWIVPEGSIGRQNFRNGEGVPAEHIDGRLHPVGWNTPLLAKEGWGEVANDDNNLPQPRAKRERVRWENAVVLGKHPTPPFTGTLLAQQTSITEYEIAPVRVKKFGDGHLVADFGKVYVGMPKITFRGGRAGTVVKIKVDYRPRPDGTLEGFAQSTRLDYTYTLRGGTETFRPYWYLGFRYVEVENSPPQCAIRMIVRHNAMDAVDAGNDINRESSFTCSDRTLNAIWDLAKRSVMLGAQEQFVDTPTREQGQFAYDAYLTAMAAMKLFRERNLTRQAFREFAQSQIKYHADTGKINAVYPNGDGRRDIPDWTQSWIFWAWEYYLETGDEELMAETFPQLVKVGTYVKSTENKQTGLVDLGNAAGYASGIVDWPNRYGYDRATTQRTVMSLNAYLDYVYLARLAKELNRSDVAERFQKYAEDILCAIQRQLWDEEQKAYIDGLYADGSKSRHASQQANAMMLALGLTEGERTRGAMAAVKRAGHSTSPLLIRFLLRAYGDHDEDDALREWLTNPQGHNYAYILADGGTFTYENWRGRHAERENSESHPFAAYGAVVALQEYVLGVKTLAPQSARVQVRPHTLHLRYARGKVPTQRGHIFVAWQLQDGAFRLTLHLPCNVRADVYVPRGQSAGTAVKVNGKERQGEAAGNYIVVREVGAGKWVLTRGEHRRNAA
ncbi:MAG: glycoside hydrolase family 78 protein [Abditibacteriales bacterium]|nr:glycoside hydrolase family 78 protein [Abditibacteriales bacterium]MDW8364521.1 family 78 glycoside hydrolase catalytic domain [Abditibacteriales bacterium]